MRNTYSANKFQAIGKLLEAIDKGIDLLTNKNLDEELYDAFERYVVSTLKLVDAYCQTCYSSDFVQFSNNSMLSHFNIPNNLGVYSNPIYPHNNPFNLNMSNYNLCSVENIGFSHQDMGIPKKSEINYQDKLQETLKKLVSISKMIVCE